jgi:hypothetical protein
LFIRNIIISKKIKKKKNGKMENDSATKRKKKIVLKTVTPVFCSVKLRVVVIINTKDEFL